MLIFKLLFYEILTCKVQLSEYKCSSDEVAQIDTFKTITSILFGINYPFITIVM